ncbi:hypothetical protein Nepgr_000160 [Nepenthes gracilis]|uniref:Uncharacterized protein n=1 Tax=Nepenthes gracilis TaxID=150966 RepID=A0AAD3P2U2_NEPGR|nr:hypothetical protein Nepgr_000160 [Nepenthes gracilis]
MGRKLSIFAVNPPLLSHLNLAVDVLAATAPQFFSYQEPSQLLLMKALPIPFQEGMLLCVGANKGQDGLQKTHSIIKKRLDGLYLSLYLSTVVRSVKVPNLKRSQVRPSTFENISLDNSATSQLKPHSINLGFITIRMPF